MKLQKFNLDLQVISSFKDAARHELYTPLPDDWYVIVSDIRGSTDAIRLGKYKEVNMAGACVIAAVNNFYKSKDEGLLPHLFGGDGALIAVPDYKIEKLKSIVSFCIHAVRKAYNLEMAAAVLQVGELRKKGHDIKAASFELSDFVHQTLFWGSGVTYAEEFAKTHQPLSDIKPIPADFSGLECRWNQVPSNKDEVATYIIQACKSNDKEQALIYQKCFEKIEEIYGREENFHPIREESLTLTANPLLLGVEWKLKTQPPNFWRRLKYGLLMAFQFISGLYLMKFGKKTTETDWGAYKPDLKKHADYKKFGDSVRFVASGKIEQRMKLTEFLERQYQQGQLAYGIHTSFAAMLTCFVQSYNKKHVHFVDGTDGGYAKAAQELKNRLKQIKPAY